MQRISAADRVLNLFGAGKDGFTDGNPTGGILATVLDAAFLNAIQEEVANAIEGSGLTLSGADNTQLLQAIRLLAAPAGKVEWFGMSAAPAGWIKANGAAVSRTVYAKLFTAVGTTYGVGDGSTTFNVPDLRGEFVRGWDDARGIDTGRAMGSAQLDALQGHLHGPGSPSTSYWAAVASGGTIQFPNAGASVVTVTNTGAPVSDGTNGTPRTASETRGRNVALLACIKF